MKTYPLNELSTQEFENLVIAICEKILGIGTINFSEGPDGGQDGKFTGTANCFPSEKEPWKGKFIIQAKRTINQLASCSDVNFIPKVIDKEIKKIYITLIALYIVLKINFHSLKINRFNGNNTLACN